VATYGVISYSVGLILEYFEVPPYLFGKILDTSGWCFMITGQSLVLYSRLNLILVNEKVLAGVKWMIICNAIVWHSSIIVVDFGTTYTDDVGFAKCFWYLEHVQMTIFCIQEFIISGLYVWRTSAFLKVVSKTSTRNIMSQLFTINVILIVMDIALLFMQYKHWRIYQTVTKAFIYSVKLKLELNILSKLVDLVRSPNDPTLLNEIDGTTMPGRAQRALRREISTPSLKPACDHVEHGHGNSSQDALADRSPSQVSNSQSSRTTGRESDILYADMVRSIK
jgi:hypothetical protein